MEELTKLGIPFDKAFKVLYNEIDNKDSPIRIKTDSKVKELEFHMD